MPVIEIVNYQARCELCPWFSFVHYDEGSAKRALAKHMDDYEYAWQHGGKQDAQAQP